MLLPTKFHLTFLAIGLSLWQTAPASASASDRPNVLVILTDDQGWGDLSLHGNPNFQTPAIDRLARQGRN